VKGEFRRPIEAKISEAKNRTEANRSELGAEETSKAKNEETPTRIAVEERLAVDYRTAE
jgi:hypothetical protein